MVKTPVTIVLVGIGGQGTDYLKALLEKKGCPNFQVQGVVDPEPERCPCFQDLMAQGIPIFDSIEEFYTLGTAELAILSTPIHLHCVQTCYALSRGSHVLCEKPPAATIQEVLRMKEAEKKAGRWVAVGYQWSYTPAIQSLKKDIQKGLFGRPKRLKCLHLWPRDEAYYRRNDWAGRQKDAAGNWILDSPMNNAMAHDLHNILYILGDKLDRSARPARVTAELYRAYDIENYDTAALRCLTESGTEVFFYVSHASFEDRGPVFSYEFESEIIFGSGRNTEVRARLADGSLKNYGVPDKEPFRKLWQAIESVRSGRRPLCGLEASEGHTLCVNGTQESMPEITNFPDSLLRMEDTQRSRRVWIEGLDEILKQCYEKALLPSELGIQWSRGGRDVSLSGYSQFPGDSAQLP